MPPAQPGTKNYDPVGAALAQGYAQQQQKGLNQFLGGVDATRQVFEARMRDIYGVANPGALWGKVGAIWLDPRYSEQEKMIAISRILGQGSGGGGGGRGGGGGGGGGGGISTAQRAAQYTAEIQNIAGQLGLEGDWAALGGQAAANNWSIEMVRDMIADRITLDTAKKAGLVKNIFDKTRAAGGDYFLKLTDEDLLAWAKRVARQELDQEAILSEVRERAKQRYHWLAPQIEQGQTMRQIFAPQRQTIAQLLEISDEQVDFINDPRFTRVVESTAMNGERYSLGTAETAKYVRGLHDWRGTSNAKAQVANAVTALAKTFGAMG